MGYLIVGIICFMAGSTTGIVIASLMNAAANEDRCRDCLNFEDLK